MRTLEELLKESSAIHGHHCAGQVLGVRMAMAGCREVGIDEPRGCKKLVVYVEMDRCATDAIQAVTGCSLGKRTLKFLDYGKMAATFVNTQTQRAVRVLAKDDARALAPEYSQGAANPREAQKNAYAVMPEELLFAIGPATVQIAAEDMPGYRGGRIFCQQCGEGVNFKREVLVQGRTLCIPCARDSQSSTYADLPPVDSNPQVLLIVGYKKTGKTTLIERLIAELSARGYRVGTVKRHHSEMAIDIDAPGTDSWRHRRAGAKSVALVTPTDVALFHEVRHAARLDDIIPTLRGTDLVLVEGFHEEAKAKIEVVSGHHDRRLSTSDDHLLALVGAAAGDRSVPCFSPESIEPLADFIEAEVLGKKSLAAARRQL